MAYPIAARIQALTQQTLAEGTQNPKAPEYVVYVTKLVS